MTKINYIPTLTTARVGNHIYLGATGWGIKISQSNYTGSPIKNQAYMTYIFVRTQTVLSVVVSPELSPRDNRVSSTEAKSLAATKLKTTENWKTLRHDG